MRMLWLLILCGLGAYPAIAEPVMIVLTQTSCQFIESEAKDYVFDADKAADCVAINQRTQSKRLTAAKPLVLSSGAYVFRVYNRDVAYDLGFWLRAKGLARLTHASVSGGGIGTGQFKDYPIELKKGEYLYSCPLNPTPDYTLVVQ